VTTTPALGNKTTVTTYANGSTQSVVHDPQGTLISVTTTPPARPTDSTTITTGSGSLVDTKA
jgi:hypothetical protein